MTKKSKILIIGAGKGGKALIELFSKSNAVHVVGVADINQAAPGIVLAKELNIPTTNDYKEFVNKKNFDGIFNSTGSEKVQRELVDISPPNVEVIGGRVARFIWELVEERRKAEEELVKAYTLLKKTRYQLSQGEKLMAVGQLASGVAHEVRNPLGIILQGVNYLEKNISPEEKDKFEVLIMVKDSVVRADKIINTLLDFSKATDLNLQPETIDSMLENSLNLVKKQLGFGNIEVTKEIEADIPKVLVERGKIEEVFINLFTNAIQAMPSGGKIMIRSYAKQLNEVKSGIGRRGEDYFRIGEKAVVVEIEDTGVGISDDGLKKIFTPFFTTKGPKGGTGLGLSVSQNILNMHKGLISVESQVGKGTKMVVILKIA